MIHSLAFILALLIGPAIVGQIIQRICRPNGPLYGLSLTYPWTIAALLIALIGTTTNHFIPNSIASNFFMHAVGGGVVSFCLTMSIIRQARFKLLLPQLLLVLLAVSCVLGVANELFEYAVELLTRGRIYFSIDTHDTWRDLLANTVGALGAFVIWWATSAMKKATE